MAPLSVLDGTQNTSTKGGIHANASPYFVMPKTGVTFRRIANAGGHVHAPHLWEHIPTQRFSSVDGADRATVPGTGTRDRQPHRVIYSGACASTNAAKPWWDSVDRACRWFAKSAPAGAGACLLGG
jgi:hypothetical protein